MTADEAKIADAKQWALTSAIQLSSALADTARALASPSHLVIKGHLQNARNLLRDAEENLTRALINLENIENR